MKTILLLRKSCVISGLQQYTITVHLSLCWSTYFIKQKIQVSPVLALVLVRKEFCTACAEVFHNLALLSMKTSLLPLSFVFLAVYCKNCCTITWHVFFVTDERWPVLGFVLYCSPRADLHLKVIYSFVFNKQTCSKRQNRVVSVVYLQVNLHTGCHSRVEPSQGYSGTLSCDCTP